MDENLDSGRIAKVLAAEYGDDGFVILEEGGEEHIVVRCRRRQMLLFPPNISRAI